MPGENEPHEGTWLQWPHHYQYGIDHRDDLDPIWVQMTVALSSSEKVHIIAYDTIEKERILRLLKSETRSLDSIDFSIFPTDDVWVRDNGPVYVKDTAGKPAILDWGFNGWGKKAAYKRCNAIPALIAKQQQVPRIDLNSTLVCEGGSFDTDGNGTFIACRSSILNKNRNPGISQETAETVFRKYLSITNFIWLDGVAGLDITDMHIDGFARFGNASTIVTMSPDDLKTWKVPKTDIEKLYAATNKEQRPYQFFQLPLTQKKVVTTYQKTLREKGSYINYYIANKVVLVPNYNDINDTVANTLLQKLYPDRKVIGIDVRDLYAGSGMIHCVTQQQPRY